MYISKHEHIGTFFGDILGTKSIIGFVYEYNIQAMYGFKVLIFVSQSLMLGLTVDTPNVDVYKTIPPDVIKYMDHVHDLDNSITDGYVGCFIFNSTMGAFKRSCPVVNARRWSSFGLDGMYVRTDYPDWLFLQGMTFRPSGRLPSFPQFAYDIPLLLSQCNKTQGCVMVTHEGAMESDISPASPIYYSRSIIFPELSGVWIKRTFAENDVGLGLEAGTYAGPWF